MEQSPRTSRLRRFVDRMPLDPKRPRHFGILAFLEASILPMPIEVITAPFMIAYPKEAFRMALSMWVGCMIASALFYTLGFLLFEPVVAPTLSALGMEQTFEAINDQFTKNGLFWTVLTMGLLPMPLQLATLGAGLLQGNLITFALAVATSRGIRYFGLAALVRFLGPKVETLLMSKRFGLILILFGIAAMGVIYWFFILPMSL